MKKLLLFLFLLYSSLNAFAANTATDMYTSPQCYSNECGIHYIKVAIDTVDTDLSVYDPGTGDSACLVGVAFSEGTATNLTFKSGTTTILVPELAANQGKWGEIRPAMCTQAGSILKVQASTAVSNMLFMVIDTAKLREH